MMVVNLGAIPEGLRIAIVNWVRHMCAHYKVQKGFRLGADDEEVITFENMPVKTATALRAEYDIMMQNMGSLAQVTSWT